MRASRWYESTSSGKLFRLSIAVGTIRCRRSRPGEYREQIRRDNGTLEPAFNGWQVGPTDPLAQEWLHCTESLRQKTNERLGFPLDLPLSSPLGEPMLLALIHYLKSGLYRQQLHQVVRYTSSHSHLCNAWRTNAMNSRRRLAQSGCWRSQPITSLTSASSFSHEVISQRELNRNSTIDLR